MNKIVGKIISTAGLVALLAAPAFAAPQLNHGTQLNSGECNKVGAPVVNVVQKVVNDVDSGEAGNNWAFDNLTRQIKVWKSSTQDEYCALVKYEGKFDAQAGQQSPGNTESLTGDEDGTFEGGYRATITGDLLLAPAWSTKGSVGTTDYQCDIAGNCPGYVSWIDQYFTPGYGFDYEWWGWIYRAGQNTWVNSVDGNSGDVL